MQNNIVRNTAILLDYINGVFPEVDYELNRWKNTVEKTQCKVLVEQALSSIKHKRFHAQGGAIYALYPNVRRRELVKFIVAFQTISDYLDNLCDRVGYTDEQGMRQLHFALEEALMPEDISKSDYYKFYPYKDDGYLNSIVDECKKILAGFPKYYLVCEEVKKQAFLYSQMQAYKHIEPSRRVQKVIKWAQQNNCYYMGINEWEFAAVAGSTLNIFALCSMASINNLTSQDVLHVADAYFPWVCGLHILLDYFIDLEEDNINGDLNFISFYGNSSECAERIGFFLKNAIQSVKQLPYAWFHLLVIRGLLSMYLSDAKVRGKQMKLVRHGLISESGSMQTEYMYYACKLLRLTGCL